MSSNPPVNYAVVLFPGFQALDAFGPLDALDVLAIEKPINLSIIGPTLDPVSTKPSSHIIFQKDSNCTQSVVVTHTYDNPPADIDVLIIPGGFGTRDEGVVTATADLLRRVYPRIRYLLTVCTGAIIPARAGLLDGKKATTNKLSFDKISKNHPTVNWVRKARWVVDGNIWTASGISAGIDAMLAFIEEQYGREAVDKTTKILEYSREEDSSNDPFA